MTVRIRSDGMLDLESLRQNNSFISTCNAVKFKLAELGAKLIQGEITVEDAEAELRREIKLWRGIHGDKAVTNTLSIFHLKGFDTK